VFKNLGIKILCLLIALLLWFQAAATTDVVEIQRLPVRLSGLTDSLTVIHSRLPESISVRLRGNRLQLLSADFLESQRGFVELDLEGMGPGHHRYDVSVLDVNGPGTPLDVVPEASLDIHVERLVTRQVPVELTSQGALPDGFVFVTDLSVSPSTVEVSGPESLVSGVASVVSARFSLGGRRESFTDRVQLLPPGNELGLRPIEVEVSGGIEPVEERLFEAVPLTVLREDDRVRIDLSPPQARVIVTGARSVLEALRPEEISVVVTIPVGVEGVTEVEAEAVVPDALMSARVEPATFQVLAEVDR
jgi:YbbR domain-containing protein